MAIVSLPKNEWIEVFSDTTDEVFHFLNQKDTIHKRKYKINKGVSTPSVATEDFLLVDKDGEYFRTVMFSNETPVNIYVMAVNKDGRIQV